LLMHLYRISKRQVSRAMARTHEPSETEMTRGARSEDLLTELWEPLDVVEERPWTVVSRDGGRRRNYAHSCYNA
jgi:hypothetical protein